MESALATASFVFDRAAAQRKGDASAAVGIRLQRVEGKTPVAVPGELLELCEREARVSLASPIPAQEPVTLRIENRRVHSELSTGGKIGGLRGDSQGNWVVNCVFNQPLPQLTLQDFFHGDLVERRKHLRYPVVGDAAIDWETGKRNLTVQLLDLSAGGFRMLAYEASALEARLHLVLRLPNHRRFVIPAVTRWQIEDADGYTTGCQFLHNQGEHLMKAILPAIADDDRTEGKLNLANILQKIARLPLFNRSG